VPRFLTTSNEALLDSIIN